MKDVKVELKDADGVKVIEYREGTLPDIIQPEKRKMKGQMGNIAAFLAHAMAVTELHIDKAHCELDADNLTATLFVDAKDPFATVITDTLDWSEEFKEIGINRKKYSRKDLYDYLRHNSFLFPDRDEHKKMVELITNFTAKVNADIQQSSDQRGNKANNFTKEVKTDIPMDIVWYAPILKGKEKNKLRLEICFDVSDNTTVFWFESYEVEDIKQKAVEKEFAALREALINHSILAIEK